MENMVSVKDLTKVFNVREKDHNMRTSFAYATGKRKRKYINALKNVDLDIGKGEILGIVGPNGAGKTTFLKIVAGLLIPEKGKIEVNGFDIIKDRHKVRTSCNFLRSGGWVIFDYKYPLHRNLEFWGVVQGLSRPMARLRVDWALDAVGLLDKRTDFPENLSAGMRQKLNLARCLIAPRPVFLLDEPTQNIDPIASNFIRTYLKEHLGLMGITGILATHNLWEAEMMCDRIAVLNEGELVMVGTVEDIKSRVGKQSVLLKHPNLDASHVERVQQLDFVYSVIHDTGILRITGNRLKENISEVLALLDNVDRMEYLDIQDLSFNDAFMELMKSKTEAR